MYYTSGTTGRPKGVVLSHAIVALHAVGTVAEMRLNRHDVWGHFAPMFHLVDAFAIYAITFVGGRHTIMRQWDTSKALLMIQRERVSVTNLASTMLTLMTSNPLFGLCDLSSLRILSAGGSPTAPAVIKRVLAQIGCEFFASYGMTETCGKISMSILGRASFGGVQSRAM